MVGEISCPGNILEGKCPIGVAFVEAVSCLEVVKSGKCPSARCLSGKCQSGICPRGSVSRAQVHSGNCPHNLGISMIWLDHKLIQECSRMIRNIYIYIYIYAHIIINAAFYIITYT